MGWIDNDGLLQDIIDTLNVKVLPGERQLPYPMPILQGVSQVINLNDFLKTKKDLLVVNKKQVGDINSGATETVDYSDIFQENKLYRLLSFAFGITAPAASTTGAHSFDFIDKPSGVTGSTLLSGVAAYNVNISFVQNSFVSVFTARRPPTDQILAQVLSNTYFNKGYGLEISYFNNTDVTQGANRNYYFKFLVETVKGL